MPGYVKQYLWAVGVYFGAPIALMVGLFAIALGLNYATVTLGFLPPGVMELYIVFFNGAWDMCTYIVLAPLGLFLLPTSFVLDIVAPYVITLLNFPFAILNITFSLPAWTPTLPSAISTFDTLVNALIALKPQIGAVSV